MKRAEKLLAIAADIYESRIWRSVGDRDWGAKRLRELERRLPGRGAADYRRAWESACALFSDAARIVYDGADMDEARRDLVRRHPGFSPSNYDAAISQALQDSRH